MTRGGADDPQHEGSDLVAPFWLLPTMVFVLDHRGVIVAANRRARSVLGDGPGLVGTPFVSVVIDDDRPAVRTAIAVTPRGAEAPLLSSLQHLDGDEALCELVIANHLDDPDQPCYLVAGQPVPGLDHPRGKLEHLAAFDVLTGVRHRRGFLTAVAELLGEAGSRGETPGGLGVVLIDIARFRSINELYGQDVGDAVLAVIADRLNAVTAAEHVVGRLGADEFGVALRASSRQQVAGLRDRVRRALQPVVRVDAFEIRLDARIVTAYDAAPDSLEPVLVTASSTMRQIKRYADPEVADHSRATLEARRQRVDELRAALAAGDVVPYFEPIVDAAGRLVAVEALARRLDPKVGVVGADDVLPLAKLAGLTPAVDQAIVGRSLATARALAEAGAGDIAVHINADPRAIRVAGFAEQFLTEVGVAGLSTSQLVLEITENDVLNTNEVTLDNVLALRAAGVSIAIDDFGTGYSSLAHLLDLPVDIVKLDQRFVAAIDSDPSAAKLTEAVLGLCNNLRLPCIAEGVERQEQHDLLVELGCRRFQGRLHSHALSARELLGSLHSRIRRAPPGTLL